nr:probable palmitoyltransferase ZDHHC24 [Drosophila bipectinata]
MAIRSLKRIVPPNALEGLFLVTLVAGMTLVLAVLLNVMMPQMVRQGTPDVTFYTLLGFFLYTNIITNMVMCILVDPRADPKRLLLELELGKGGKDWHECTECQMWVPPRSRHCRICAVCVLKRDHHCILTGCCVGHHNYRYFFYFVLYMFLASATSFVVGVDFVFVHRAGYFEFYPIYVALFMIVTILSLVFMVMSAFILFKQWPAIRYGASSPEADALSFQYNLGMLSNLRMFLGKWMILTWISPFIPSPLPHDGIHWELASSEDQEPSFVE